MQNYEEIFILIKKWFEGFFVNSIDIPDDLSDGSYYLKLLKKCKDLDIPNIKNKNFEIIECTLDEFYGFKTSCVVDYFEFLFIPSNENIISLCILCFVFCEKYKLFPSQLTEDDFRRLKILTRPVYSSLKQKKLPSPERFRSAIEKAANMELKDMSLSLSSVNGSFRRSSKTFKKPGFQLRSDDEISIISDKSSFASELSPYQISNVNLSIDSEVNIVNKDQFSRTGHIKNTPITKNTLNPQMFYSPLYYQSVESGKSRDSKKMDHIIKKLECDNSNLKQFIDQCNEEIEKLTESEKRLSLENSKYKTENQKMMDYIDCLKSENEKKDLSLSLKVKELEKMKNESEMDKKKMGDKSDEIKQLEHSNQKLRKDIHDLNHMLTLKHGECQKLESANREKRNIEIENLNLKDELEHLRNQIIDLRNPTHRIRGLDESLEYPIENTTEIGESLDIINQMKLAEMREELENKTMMLEKEIGALKVKIDDEKTINAGLSKSQLEITEKYKEALSDLENYQLKLSINEKELTLLKERNLGLSKGKEESLNVETSERSDETTAEDVVEKLKRFFSKKNISSDEKTEIFNLARRVLGIEYGYRENEMSKICRKMSIFKEEINEKDSHIREMYVVIDENQIQLFHLKQELTDCQLDRENVYRSWQNCLLKIEEKDCQLKNCQEEIRIISLQNNKLKTDLFVAESDLEKSNQDFNLSEARFNKCFSNLTKITEERDECRLIIEALMDKKERKYTNKSSCQTSQPPMCSCEKENSYQRNRDLRRVSQTSRKFLDQNTDSIVGKTMPFKNFELNETIRMTDINSVLTNANCEYFDSSKYCKAASINQSLTDEKCNCSRNVERNDPNLIVDSKFQKKLKVENKVESPAVKEARLRQMISRNLQTASHLRTSYPIETQVLSHEYLSRCSVNEIHLDDSKTVEVISSPKKIISQTSKPEKNTTTSSRSVVPSQIMRMSEVENPISLDVMKPKKTLSSRNTQMNIRSNNGIPTNIPSDFKKPLPVQKKASISIISNSDKENIVSFADDIESTTSASLTFEIFNSPKGKMRGFPGNPKKRLNRIS